MDDDKVRIVVPEAETLGRFAICGYRNQNNSSLQSKRSWMEAQYSRGLEHRLLHVDGHGAVGGIEFVPAEEAWRPVQAPGWLFIHCIYIMKKQFKNCGYGRLLLDSCLQNARERNAAGVAVTVRRGSWMAGPDLFLSAGFRVVDSAAPDFQLLACKLGPAAQDPFFPEDLPGRAAHYGEGITVFASAQCPYVHKVLGEIRVLAEEEFGFTPRTVVYQTAQEAQQAPSPFGTFCIVADGQVVADNPVSATRFRNIVKGLHRQK